MTSPFGYVSPEQIMRDKSDFARKGIARGRSVLVLTYADGILFLGENPSRALHKVSEIYDRIAFAAVGKYNEFENLRLAGVRYADLRGYQYDRSDVTSRGLANAYAQTLGTIFTESGKPYEVELTVAEVGRNVGEDQLYRLTYDGSVAEEHGFVVMGGASEPIATVLAAEHRGEASLAEAVTLARRALTANGPDTEPRVVPAEAIEAAVLDRTRPRRAFKRLSAAQLSDLFDDRHDDGHDNNNGHDNDDGAAPSTTDEPSAAIHQPGTAPSEDPA